MIKAPLHTLRLAALVGLSLAMLTACGDDGDGGNTVDPLPCGGACPADQCVFGMCVGAPNNDTNNDVPDGDDMNNDTPDGDDMNNDTPDGDDMPDVPEGCQGDEDCEEGETCDVDSGECFVACEGDDDDPGDDACQDAQTLNLQDDTEFVLEGASLCGGDLDHMAVDMLAGQRLEVAVTADPENALVLISVLDDGCGNALTDADDGSLVFTAEADGTYTILIEGGDGNPGFGYDVAVTRSAVPEMCPIDDNEPNEDSDNADDTQITPGGDGFEADGLSICAGDEDWFAFDVPDVDHTVSVTLGQSRTAPALKLELFDADGLTVLAEDDGRGEKEVEIVLPTAGTYFVRVLEDDDAPVLGVTYDLNVVVTPPEMCMGDEFEPNDSIDDANPIPPGGLDAWLCDEDTDFHEFAVNTGDTVSLALQYNHDGGDLIGTLYDPNDNIADFFVRDGNSDRDLPAQLGDEFVVETPGTWVLSVERQQIGPQRDYTIALDIERNMDTGCDENPPNNDCNSATILAPFTTIDGLICEGGDEDWYVISVGAGQSLSIDVEHFHFDGNLDVIVYGPSDGACDDEVAGFSFNAGPNIEEVDIDNTVAGDYLIRIFPTSALTENDYSIRATVN